MALGPNRVPGRCEVPPSNGAPMITTSASAYVSGSRQLQAGTPRKVKSGPYIAPYRLMPLRPSSRRCLCWHRSARTDATAHRMEIRCGSPGRIQFGLGRANAYRPSVIENRRGYGIGLAGRFYEKVVAPRLTDQPHAAALLGPGSEVLGYDDATSTDHGFGPRVQIFVADSDAVATTEQRFADLDGAFEGMPVRFPRYDDEPATHQVRVTTPTEFFAGWLGVDPAAGLSVADWLLIPTQVLGSMIAGAVFHDPDGELADRRAALEWYPDDVWRYALASAWLRIGQEEPFVGRAGARGDDLGSRI